MSQLNKKICKVIATSLHPRKIRKTTTICGTPPGYFAHSQNYANAEEIIKLLELNIKVEESNYSGQNMTLVIVNNEYALEKNKWENFVNKYKNKVINGNKIIFETRENIGRSFGAYDYAFRKYKEIFDYFIFTEDDVLIHGEEYATTAINEFNSYENVGFVSIIGISNKIFGNSNLLPHAHGGVGISSTKILKKIYDKNNGKLSYSIDENKQEYSDIILYGEIAFSADFLKNGYRVRDMNNNVKLYDFAYDYERNINKKRYLSLIERVFYNLRHRNFTLESWR